MVASIIVSNSQDWLSGARFGSLTATQTAWGVLTIAFLVAVDHVNRVAGEAFDTFRVALTPGRIDEVRVRYELTTASRRTSIVLLVVSFPLTIAFYVSDPVGSKVAGLSPAALVGRTVFESLFSAIALTIIVHGVRQLRLVSRLHALADRIDPFNPEPLHAFSRLTSQTGMALVLMIAFGLALNPVAVGSESAALLWAPWVVGVPAVAVAIFVVPLLGMHRRLVAAKAGLQGAAEERLKAVLAAVHEDVDALDLRRADGLQKTLGSVLQEREILAKLPTWPWSAGTLRGFVTAILLPLVLFVGQRLLGDVLLGR
ncbi:MAG: hypothetical protein EPO36_11380 [Chloroflexota bacterium]|nr:MAG: hypothetical protein EPO36_11380 [Chloroflexota bacterium]